MTKRYFCVLLIVTMAAIACEKAKEMKPLSFKDSVLEQYINFNDTDFYWEKENMDQKFVKAYYRNDTSFLTIIKRNLHHEFDQNNLPEWLSHIPSLKTLNVEEAYQINYGEVFCDYSTNFTITKNGDSINLHTIISTLVRNKDSISSIIYKEYDKALKPADWDKFYRAVDYADYWGLQTSTGGGGDCSSLRMTAVKRNHFDHKFVRAKFVERICVQGTALYDLFKLLVAFSGSKDMCNSR